MTVYKPLMHRGPYRYFNGRDPKHLIYPMWNDSVVPEEFQSHGVDRFPGQTLPFPQRVATNQGYARFFNNSVTPNHSTMFFTGHIESPAEVTLAVRVKRIKALGNLYIASDWGNPTESFYLRTLVFGPFHIVQGLAGSVVAQHVMPLDTLLTHHTIVLTCNGVTTSLYVDGVKVSAAASGPAIAADSTLLIGSNRAFTAANLWNGNMYWLEYEERAWTDNEVAIFNKDVYRVVRPLQSVLSFKRYGEIEMSEFGLSPTVAGTPDVNPTVAARRAVMLPVVGGKPNLKPVISENEVKVTPVVGG